MYFVVIIADEIKIHKRNKFSDDNFKIFISFLRNFQKFTLYSSDI